MALTSGSKSVQITSVDGINSANLAVVRFGGRLRILRSSSAVGGVKAAGLDAAIRPASETIQEIFPGAASISGKLVRRPDEAPKGAVSSKEA